LKKFGEGYVVSFVIPAQAGIQSDLNCEHYIDICFVIPAQAGIQSLEHWIPAFAGMTICTT
jgi:hypothetical protein